MPKWAKLQCEGLGGVRSKLATWVSWLECIFGRTRKETLPTHPHWREIKVLTDGICLKQIVHYTWNTHGRCNSFLADEFRGWSTKLDETNGKKKNPSYLTPYPTMTTYMSTPTKPSMPAKRTYLPHQHDLIPKCGRKKLIRPRISTRKTDVPKREKETNRRFSPVDSCTQSHGKVGRQQGPRSALCPVAAGRGPRVAVLRETK